MKPRSEQAFAASSATSRDINVNVRAPDPCHAESALQYLVLANLSEYSLGMRMCIRFALYIDFKGS